MLRCIPNIIDHTEGKLAEVVEMAKSMGLWYGRRGLRRQLFYLATYANRRGCQFDRKVPGQKTVCKLFRDFAPWSFFFRVEFYRGDVVDKRPMCGGLIYSGPGVPADGSFPSLTVSLCNRNNIGWSINT